VYGEGRQGHPGQPSVIEYLHVQENTSKEKCTNPECTPSLHSGTALLLDLVQVFYDFAD
jgi:hypothetical protein